jgi:hypothetical protein
LIIAWAVGAWARCSASSGVSGVGGVLERPPDAVLRSSDFTKDEIELMRRPSHVNLTDHVAAVPPAKGEDQ